MGQWYKSARDSFHNLPVAVLCRGRESAQDGGGRVEFANLPHDFAETLELVFVGISIVAGLAILVAFGQWWQR